MIFIKICCWWMLWIFDPSLWSKVDTISIVTYRTAICGSTRIVWKGQVRTVKFLSAYLVPCRMFRCIHCYTQAVLATCRSLILTCTGRSFLSAICECLALYDHLWFTLWRIHTCTIYSLLISLKYESLNIYCILSYTESLKSSTTRNKATLTDITCTRW